VRSSDLVAILTPDHIHKELFENEIYKNMRPRQTFLFAHSMSVHFGLVQQPSDVNFVLVAPHGPGTRLREKYLEGDGLLSFIAATKGSSAECIKLAAAYAKAVGCSRHEVIVTDFAAEAVGDIFGEQAVLCGGLSALLKAGFDTLVASGLPPHNAYIECIHQLDLIIDLIKRYGIDGMYDRISTTAAFGSLMAEDKIITPAVKKSMRDILKKISEGRFTSELMKDYEKSFPKLKALKNKKRNTILEETAARFRREILN
jgi:ketol-acid reductoisomerase